MMERSDTTEFSLRLAGRYATPARIASWMEPPESRRPLTSAVPPSGLDAPKRQVMSSEAPQPIRPVSPITWPRLASSVTFEKPSPL